MDDNEFKLDFDFEKEYGFDPNDFLTTDSDGFDYSQFDEQPQEEAAQTPVEQVDDATAVWSPEQVAEVQAAAQDEAAAEPTLMAFGQSEESDAYDDAQTPFTEGDGEGMEAFPEAGEDQQFYEEEEEEKPKRGFHMPKIPVLPKISLPGGKKTRRRPRAGASEEENPVGGEEAEEPKPKSALSRLVEIYMEPITQAAAEDMTMDPLDPRYIRRKKKEKKRIFKEVYLPAIIACVALFMILSFIVGSISNALIIHENKQALAMQEAQEQASSAERAEERYRSVVAQAEALAVGYNYDDAIQMLRSFTDASYQQQINAKITEIEKERSAMVEWKDVSTIPNLSFHVLMADASRACDKSVSGDLAGSYNRNFVSVEEFSRILNQLYAANYILVDFNSFVSPQPGTDGNVSFYTKEMLLPAGKKPVMITETMVNYFEYMVDPDKDGEADAKGHGFANKLVVDANGNIKASYVDASGQSLVGNYDLVPVLESFIQEHPDFSYRGARATLAVSGTEGVFGYRTNTSYVATRGQAYYDNECAQAKVLVQALRDKGYNIACYTYSNQNYKTMTTLQIQGEMTNWNNQITPVVGNVDTIVFARGGDIDAYSGTTFNVLYGSGLRYFVNSGTSPRVDVNTTFVKQTRLMVTGESMTWYSSQFSEYFDCNIVLDIASRGSQPTKG